MTLELQSIASVSKSNKISKKDLRESVIDKKPKHEAYNEVIDTQLNPISDGFIPDKSTQKSLPLNEVKQLHEKITKDVSDDILLSNNPWPEIIQQLIANNTKQLESVENLQKIAMETSLLAMQNANVAAKTVMHAAQESYDENISSAEDALYSAVANACSFALQGTADVATSRFSEPSGIHEYENLQNEMQKTQEQLSTQQKSLEKLGIDKIKIDDFTEFQQREINRFKRDNEHETNQSIRNFEELVPNKINNLTASNIKETTNSIDSLRKQQIKVDADLIEKTKWYNDQYKKMQEESHEYSNAVQARINVLELRELPNANPLTATERIELQQLKELRNEHNFKIRGEVSGADSDGFYEFDADGKGVDKTYQDVDKITHEDAINNKAEKCKKSFYYKLTHPDEVTQDEYKKTVQDGDRDANPVQDGDRDANPVQYGDTVAMYKKYLANQETLKLFKKYDEYIQAHGKMSTRVNQLRSTQERNARTWSAVFKLSAAACQLTGGMFAYTEGVDRAEAGLLDARRTMLDEVFSTVTKALQDLASHTMQSAQDLVSTINDVLIKALAVISQAQGR